MSFFREHVMRDVLVNGLGASPLVSKRLRWLLLRLYGFRMGRARIAHRCFFGGPDVRLGDGVFINVDAFFDGSDRIVIGNRVHIGMGAMLLTGTHALGDPECRAGELRSAPIIIGDGCWLGARTVVMPGVTIGYGTVVAAGAVVSSSCEPNSVYAGVPARRTRELAPRGSSEGLAPGALDS